MDVKAQILNQLKNGGADLTTVSNIKNQLKNIHSIEDLKNIIKENESVLSNAPALLSKLKSMDVDGIANQAKNVLPPAGDAVVDAVTGFLKNKNN